MRFLQILLAISVVFSGHLSLAEQSSYRLQCESNRLLFDFEIAGYSSVSSSVELTVYERRGGGKIKVAQVPLSAELHWNTRSGERYISGIEYVTSDNVVNMNGEVVHVYVGEIRSGGLENRFPGGTRYLADVISTHPLLSFAKSQAECESYRVVSGLSPSGGGTSM